MIIIIFLAVVITAFTFISTLALCKVAGEADERINKLK